jgi:PAS domain S-box-containing protein
MRRRNPSRLALGAAFGLVALIVLSALSALSYVSANRWVDHTLEVRQRTDAWAVTVLDAARGVHGYLLSGQSAFLAPYQNAIERETQQAERIASLVQDNPRQAENVRQAAADARATVAFFADVVALEGAGHRDEALARVATGEGQRDIDMFRADADRMRGEESRLLVIRRARADRGALLTVGGGAFVAAMSLGLLAVAWRLQTTRVSLLSSLEENLRHHLEALSMVAAALANARTRSQVVDVVIEQGMRVASADTCTLYSLNEAGDALELIGERGVDPDVLDKIRRISETAGTPATFATLRSAESLWAESDGDYASQFPTLAALKTQGRRARAFWSVPLIVEGRAVGLLGMGFYGPRKFSPEERAFVSTFAQQCAQALQRAARLEREDETRNLFTTTLRSIGDAVIATDLEGRVTFMNPVAEHLTGWQSAAAVGRPLGEVFPILSEQTREPVENPVTKVLREGMVVGLANHTVLRAKQGHEVPIDDSAAPIRDEAGRLFGVVLVFRDVTEEKRGSVRRDFLAKASQVLASSLDYRRTLGAVAELAVPELADWCTVDVVEPGAKAPQQLALAHADPAKIEFAKELARRYPPDPNAATGIPEVIRSGKSELYPEIPSVMLERGARDAEHLRLLQALQLASAMIVPLRGRERILGAMTFIFAESGRRYTQPELSFAENFAHLAGMAIENAMAVKQLEEARSQERYLRSEAESASRAKDEFLATVSHELRTPLNAILGWTVMLRARNLPADLERPLSVIERNARAQAKLIEDVLDVSRIISGKLSLKLGATNVRDAIDASIETVIPSAQAKGVKLSADIDDASMLITADADRLQQVVWNLLTNAVKFTPKGGEVWVRAGREGSSVSIVVKDSGEGIDPSALPYIFESFHQADASTTRRHGGLGLGLAIVKQLVIAHGGTIRATSEGRGKGAIFVVKLPVREAAVRAPVDRAGLVGGRVVPRLDGLRLLVIDDEEDARYVVATVLRGQGAEVHLAASAIEALAKLEDVRPDVVVSDIGMPETDGYALIRQIRALPATLGGRTPAVALTAYARREDAERAFAAGFQMHVAKPIEPAQLAIVVANLGGRSQDLPS